MWNAQSLRPKVPELSKFLEKNSVDIVLISETWLNPSIVLNIPGYIFYRKDRDSASRFPHGGVGVLIRKTVSHSLFRSYKTNFIENLFIKVPFQDTELHIGVVYCPPNTPMQNFKEEFNKLFSTSHPTIIAGDVNAKHQYWNNTKTDRKGS